MNDATPNTEQLLRTRMAELRADVDEIKGRTAPQRARLAELVEQQNALDPEIARLSAEVHAHDSELADKKKQIANIAIALGAKSLRNQ